MIGILEIITMTLEAKPTRNNSNNNNGNKKLI